jgi:hypothetical protein
MTLDLLLISAGIALNPFSLSAFFVLLPSTRGVRKGAAFVFGWLASLAIVVAATLLATQNHPPKPNTAPSLAALAVKAAIGGGLVVIAVRRRRGTGKPKPPKPPPKWQARVDSMSLWYALALGALVQPWGLIGAGVATVVEMDVSTAASFLTLLAFCVLGSSSYIGIELYMAFRPQQSAAMLDRIQSWVKRHTDQVIIVGSLTLGFWLIGHSLYLILTD